MNLATLQRWPLPHFTTEVKMGKIGSALVDLLLIHSGTMSYVVLYIYNIYICNYMHI